MGSNHTRDQTNWSNRTRDQTNWSNHTRDQTNWTNHTRDPNRTNRTRDPNRTSNIPLWGYHDTSLHVLHVHSELHFQLGGIQVSKRILSISYRRTDLRVRSWSLLRS